MLIWCVGVSAVENYPCIGTVTTRLNVRTGPGTQYRKVGLLTPGSQVVVVNKADVNWLLVEYDNQRGYVNSKYLELSPMPQRRNEVVRHKPKDSGSVNWIWSVAKILIVVAIYYFAIIIFFRVWVKILYVCMRLIKNISMMFFVFNWLQRFLHKPWYLFFKKNHFSDETNKVLRIVTILLKIPLYVLFTPLRFANAVFYNLFIHCAFEMLNYTSEVVEPSAVDEGGYEPRAIHLLLWRIIKYPLWHGILVIIESVVWTVIDTIFPALTLYHGTDATGNIVSSPNRCGADMYGVGVWLVGTGNYAGNGIYFASALRTAEHYAGHNSIIVCRVTLGKTLDLGMAPRYVYNQCGHPNATGATRWGLDNGYATGEWWRPDCSWWEFCLYDWQNRYNESWRIRPLYILGAYDRGFIRVEGGMHHWLFRKMVVMDIFTSIWNAVKRPFL